MNDLELADAFERGSAWVGSAKDGFEGATAQIIAALRRGRERPPSGEMVMVLKEINSRFEELFHELPQDSSWWTAGDRRARKTWDKLRAMIAAAEAEGRKS